VVVGPRLESGSAKLKAWRIVALVLVLAVAAALGVARWWFGPTVQGYPVTRGDVVQTVVASGRVATPRRVAIGSQITGTVETVPVAEGESVSAGQMLITLKDDEYKAAVETARAAVSQAEARLKQLRDVALPSAQQSMRQAKATLLNARQQYDRVKDLSAKGFVGQSQVDDAKKTLDVAESQLRAAELQVETARASGSDYLIGKLALQEASANLSNALARLDYTTIEAPVAGTLITRDVEVGDVVQPGKVLMALSPVGETQLVVQIDEKHLANLRLGQRALASADAYPTQTFDATLSYINPSVDPERGSIEVKLTVPSPPAYLRQDMTVSVDIEVARQADALTIPLEAVRDVSGAPWVIKIAKRRAVRQDVTLGAVGSSKVEIAQGLTDSDVVLSATGNSVAPGRRVSVILPQPANTGPKK
jgi:HlyD family secretion protein